MEKLKQITSSELARLIENTFPIILNYAKRRYPSIENEVIQDLISESIAHIIMKKDDIFKVILGDSEPTTKAEIEKRFQSYVLASFRNRLSSELRRTQTSYHSLNKSEFFVVASQEEQHEQKTELNLKLDLLDKALDQLNESDKELIKLFYYETRPLEEIAKKLGYSSPSVVKTRKYRVMKKLKDILYKLTEKEASHE